MSKMQPWHKPEVAVLSNVWEKAKEGEMMQLTQKIHIFPTLEQEDVLRKFSEAIQ